MLYKIYSIDGILIAETDNLACMDTKWPFSGFIVSRVGTYWYKNDSFHREDGPAIELNDGHIAYYLENKKISGATKESFKLLVDIMKLKKLL